MNNEHIKKEELDKSFFVSFCIEQYKKHLNVSGNYIIDLFDQYGVVNYLYDNYDVLHTQGSQWLIEEIDNFIAEQQKGT